MAGKCCDASCLALYAGERAVWERGQWEVRRLRRGRTRRRMLACESLRGLGLAGCVWNACPQSLTAMALREGVAALERTEQAWSWRRCCSQASCQSCKSQVANRRHKVGPAMRCLPRHSAQPLSLMWRPLIDPIVRCSHCHPRSSLFLAL